MLSRRQLGVLVTWRFWATMALLALIAWGAALWRRWPDIARLRTTDPTAPATIVREQLIRAPLAVQWEWVSIETVSPHLVRAVLVAEDINFFSHGGFAWGAIRAALAGAVRAGSPPFGASTVTQQLAKNLWLTPERTLWRKLREAALTVQLERDLPKRRILELYLNVVAFGPGVFGVEAAARHFFAKPALFLTEREGAMLAASLSRPSAWNPRVDDDDYLERVDLIERRMAAAEFLWRHIATW